MSEQDAEIYDYFQELRRKIEAAAPNPHEPHSPELARRYDVLRNQVDAAFAYFQTFVRLGDYQ